MASHSGVAPSEIAARKDAVRRERLTRQRQLDVINSVDAMLWEMAVPAFQIVYISPAVERMLGYSVSEVLERFREPPYAFHPDDAGRTLEAARRATEMREPYVIEYRLIAADGRVLWMRDRIRPIIANGQVVGLRGVAIDITDKRAIHDQLERQVAGRTRELREANARLEHLADERRKAELESRQLRDRLEFVLEATQTGLDIVDGDHNVIFANQFWERELGEPNGRKCYEYFRGRSEPCENCPAIRALAAKQTVTIEEHLSILDRRPVQIISTPFQDPEGKWLVAEINVDISARVAAEARMRELQHMFEAAFKANPALMAITGLKDGRIIEINDALTAFIGKPREQLIGTLTMEHDMWVEPGRRTLLKDAMERDGRVHAFECVSRNAAGEPRTVLLYGESLTLACGPCILGVGIDVTDEREALEALRESEERYRQLAEAMRVLYDALPIPTFTWAPVGGELVLQNVNAAACGIIDAQPDDTERPTFQGLFGDMPGLHELLLEGMHARAPIEQEITRSSGDGTNQYFSCTVGPVTPDGVVMHLQDITDRKLFDQRLADYQEQLRSLASELTLAEERERRRIASELHDNVCQTLALANIRLGALHAACADVCGEETFGEVRDMIEQSIQAARTLTVDLSPPILYELGLEAALEWLAERLQEQHQCRIEFSCTATMDGMHHEVAVILFIVTRELIMNALRHASPGEVRVAVSATNRALEISVRDDGAGFTPGDTERDSFGLFSVRERVRRLGGQLTIASEPGVGTHASVRVEISSDHTSGKS